MKKIKLNRFFIVALGLLVTIGLFLVGKGSGHEEGIAMANIGAVVLTAEEKEGFNENEQKILAAVKKYALNLKEEYMKGAVKKEDLAAIVGGIQMELKGEQAKTLKEQLEELKEAAKKQGTSLQELSAKWNGIEAGNKSIAQVLEENKEELRKTYQNGSGNKQFMINLNEKGQMVARPFDPTKAEGVHGTIDGIGAGVTSSVAHSLSAAAIMRSANDAPIQSQYRNTPLVFDLCNLVNVGFDMPIAIWFDEQAKQGSSANVAEGGTKPVSQYSYALKSAEYKKEATLLGFSDEFRLDFDRLYSDITGKGRVDLVNRMNTAILTRIIAAAVAYNTQDDFGKRPAANVNDWVALAAMAAQVDNATFGANANAAVMSTFKKYNLGTAQTDDKSWLNTPDVLSNVAMIGNSSMSPDNILVGDFSQYNIMMRGGLILKVGYNGTDFAENKFSTVIEQYYFDYISDLRKPAIVKGTTFGAVKTALTEA